ncbi:MAG: hypothetical protein AAGE94_02720 [Acidobacteriota bacterium]
MMRWLGHGLVFVVSSILALSGAEIAIRASGLFAAQRAALATRDPAVETGAPASATAPITENVVNPFNGWSRRPEMAQNLPGPISDWTRRNMTPNVFGFRNEMVDYRDHSESDFTIGVFGGSVGSQLVLYGGDTLVAEVETRLPALRGRVRILTFTLGGYKQPQQLMLLSQMIVLGVPLDVVVNIDGFNELALGGSDALQSDHPIFPSRNHWTGVLAMRAHELSRDEVVRIAEIERARRRRDALADFAESNPLGRLALVQSVLGGVALRAQRNAAEAEAGLQADAGSRLAATTAQLSDPCLGRQDACWDLIADLWQRSSLAMNALASQVGAVYVHILQPNQYVADSKPLSREELETSYRPDSAWSRAAAHGYPYLRARGAELRRQGVDFLDLTTIFRDETRTVYSDSCCHLNPLGCRLVAEATAEAIRDAVERAQTVRPAVDQPASPPS